MIIFDLDGTLLDTLDDLSASMNRTLEYFNLSTHPVDSYRLFVGNGLKKLVERAIPDNEPRFDAIFEMFLDDYSKHYLVDSKPYPYVMDALKELNKRGIPIAICTNKKQEFTDNIVNSVFSEIRFESVMGDTFDGFHKPNPQKPLAIAEIFGTDPKSIYFVGDSSVDMDTARNATMIPVGVSWGFRSVEELKEHGAQLIIDRLDSLIDLVCAKVVK